LDQILIRPSRMSSLKSGLLADMMYHSSDIAFMYM
jgi:hypothetical protein